MATNLRFYLPKEILDSEEFKEKLSEVGCSHKIFPGYIQFSNVFLHLQPSSFISDNLFKYLDEKTTEATLLVEKVPISLLMRGIQTSCEMRNLPISYGRGTKKVSMRKSEEKTGNNPECVHVLFEEKSSFEIFKSLKEFIPGIFQEIIPERKYKLFHKKLRLSQ